MTYYFTLKGKIPSKKNLWKRSRNGMYLDKDARADLDALLWQFKGQKRPAKPLSGAIGVTFNFVQAMRRGDMDNKITAILDLLQKSEIIKNDKDVCSIGAERNWGDEDKVVLSVWKIGE